MDDVQESKEQWDFDGTIGDFICMVQYACVVWELVRRRRSILPVFIDTEKYKAAEEEFGITYEAVKSEMRKNLEMAEMLDRALEKVKSACNVQESEQS